VLKVALSLSEMSSISEMRPWGTFAVLEEGAGFKVKRLTVNPGHRLSLQYHYKRDEHWVVVSGLAQVTLDDQIVIVGPNQYVHVQSGTIHRIENVGPDPLVVIEVQFGDYVGEDDIVRLHDDYSRERN
jgi:mannose-6-phosphate isomerase